MDRLVLITDAFGSCMWKRFSGLPTASHKLTVRPLGRTIEASERSTLLDAALDAGVPIPFSCNVGDCGSCICRLISGEVEELNASAVISPAQRQAGFLLACQTRARSDVTVELPGADGAIENHPTLKTEGTIVATEHLTHDILEIQVELDTPMAYTAGQYAELAIPGVLEEGRNYSFAAAPAKGERNLLVFHIRHVPGGAFSGWLHKEDRLGAKLRVIGPHGQFALRSSTSPILCVAGGTGMAPILSVLEQALLDGVQREVTYFFGCRQQRDLYSIEAMERLAADWPVKFRFEPVLSEEPIGTDWQGNRGFVTQLIRDEGEKQVMRAKGKKLSDHEAYLCGPPGMIDSAFDILVGFGVDPNKIFFDKFVDKRHTIG